MSRTAGTSSGRPFENPTFGHLTGNHEPFCRLRDFGHLICFFGRYSEDIDCRSAPNIPKTLDSPTAKPERRLIGVEDLFLICVEFAGSAKIVNESSVIGPHIISWISLFLG